MLALSEHIEIPYGANAIAAWAAGYAASRAEGAMAQTRRQFLDMMIGTTVAAIAPRAAGAQTYPARPVRLVVGIAAGSAPDIFARLLGQWFSDRFGQPYIIENKPGAGTNIATEAVVRAPPDGYTLLLVSAPNTINATLYAKINFDFLRDIAPVGSFVDSPEFLLVHPSIPAATVSELIAYAKSHPGKLTMASPGVGSGPHMSGELFKRMAGIDMTHVPYRGGGPAMADLIGGQVSVTFAAPAVALDHIRAGKVRALGVTTASRSPLLPDIPTMAETLPGYRSGGFFGLGAPKGTPPDIIDMLNREINAALADAGTKARIAGMGVSALGGSPADFGRFLTDETEKWAKVIQFARLKPT
jgi:tripartite-type tricarboxylate transporter receptor subunit TctC